MRGGGMPKGEPCWLKSLLCKHAPLRPSAALVTGCGAPVCGHPAQGEGATSEVLISWASHLPCLSPGYSMWVMKAVPAFPGARGAFEGGMGAGPAHAAGPLSL